MFLRMISAVAGATGTRPRRPLLLLFDASVDRITRSVAPTTACQLTCTSSSRGRIDRKARATPSLVGLSSMLYTSTRLTEMSFGSMLRSVTRCGGTAGVVLGVRCGVLSGCDGMSTFFCMRVDDLPAHLSTTISRLSRCAA